MHKLHLTWNTYTENCPLTPEMRAIQQPQPNPFGSPATTTSKFAQPSATIRKSNGPLQSRAASSHRFKKKEELKTQSTLLGVPLGTENFFSRRQQEKALKGPFFSFFFFFPLFALKAAYRYETRVSPEQIREIFTSAEEAPRGRGPTMRRRPGSARPTALSQRSRRLPRSHGIPGHATHGPAARTASEERPAALSHRPPGNGRTAGQTGLPPTSPTPAPRRPAVTGPAPRSRQSSDSGGGRGGGGKG